MVHGDLPHIQRLPKCAEASPTDQIFQIGPGEALRAAGEGVQVHIFGQRHFPGVDADNPPPSALVGDADIDQFIETAGTEEGRLDQLESIGRANHDYRLSFLQPTHCGNDSHDHSLRYLWTTTTTSQTRNHTTKKMEN